MGYDIRCFVEERLHCEYVLVGTVFLGRNKLVYSMLCDLYVSEPIFQDKSEGIPSDISAQTNEWTDDFCEDSGTFVFTKEQFTEMISMYRRHVPIKRIPIFSSIFMDASDKELDVLAFLLESTNDSGRLIAHATF